MTATTTRTQPELIFVSALNIDYIVSGESSAFDAVPEAGISFDPHTNELRTEHLQKLPRVIESIEESGQANVKSFLGGAAFNALHTLIAISNAEKLSVPVLGFVGVAGSDDRFLKSFRPDMSFFDWFDQHSEMIDQQFLWRVEDKHAGLGVRSAKTTLLSIAPAANVLVAQLLQEKKKEITSYFASAKMVMISSLYDRLSPTLLFDVLKTAKIMNPKLIIGIDPGQGWIDPLETWGYYRQRMKEVSRDYMALADYTFVDHNDLSLLYGQTFENSEEFPQPVEPQVMIETVLNHFRIQSMVLLDSHKETSIWTLRGGTLSSIQNADYPGVDKRYGREGDTTGTGGILSGIVSMALVQGEPEMPLALCLALRLMQLKAGDRGTGPYADFPEVVSEIMSRAGK